MAWRPSVLTRAPPECSGRLLPKSSRGCYATAPSSARRVASSLPTLPSNIVHPRRRSACMSAVPASHPLGHSGLKVSPLWLGTMMFGDQTDEAEAARIVAAARDGRRQLHRHRRFVRQGRVGAHRRPADRARSRALGARDQGRQPDERRSQRPRPVAALADAGRRRQPAAPRHRLDRRLLHAPRRRGHAARGDACGDGRPDRASARSATTASPTSAPGASRDLRRDVPRAHGRAAADRLPAVLQRDEPHARDRGAAVLRALRRRRRAPTARWRAAC